MLIHNPVINSVGATLWTTYYIIKHVIPTFYNSATTALAVAPSINGRPYLSSRRKEQTFRHLWSRTTRLLGSAFCYRYIKVPWKG